MAKRWKPSEAFVKVQGRCPSCGHKSLFLGKDGYVTCGSAECPDPGAASDLLEHVQDRAELGGRYEEELSDLGRELGEALGKMVDAGLAEGRTPQVEQVVLAVVYQDGDGEFRAWKTLVPSKVSAARGLVHYVIDTMSGDVAS